MSSQMDGYTRALLEKLAQIGRGRATLAAQLVKLQDEVDEVKEAAAAAVPWEAGLEGVLRELADVVIVCHTAAYSLGYGAEDFAREVIAKAQINAQRDWFPTASGTARHTPEEGL